uniref:Transcription factor zinc-finger domain-containing protein n=1 Tax=viral metagenome TaxID=1070528 RepID=A0A6M3LVU7_9ZZZZ
MSEDMARAKKEDIENFENEKKQIIKEIQDDKCPACGLPTAKIEFFNPRIIQTFGWVECSMCGNVYVPKSILKQKRTIAQEAKPLDSVSAVINP